MQSNASHKKRKLSPAEKAAALAQYHFYRSDDQYQNTNTSKMSAQEKAAAMAAYHGYTHGVHDPASQQPVVSSKQNSTKRRKLAESEKAAAQAEYYGFQAPDNAPYDDLVTNIDNFQALKKPISETGKWLRCIHIHSRT